MKLLCRLLLLMAFLPSIAEAFDHKSCVLEHMRVSLNAGKSCQTEKLKGSVDQVQTAYADCDRDMVISQDSVSLDELKKISAADYDREIRGLISDKILSCGYKADVQLKSKGLIGSVNFLKSTGDKKAVVATENQGRQ